MHLYPRLPRKSLAALSALVALALVVPASALATSTTVTPAGDSFSVSSATLKIDWHLTGGAILTCPVTAYTGKVPASPSNHNGSGAVKLSIVGGEVVGSSCTNTLGWPEMGADGGPLDLSVLGGASPTASSQWSLGVYEVPAGCEIVSANLTGAWKNGTTSPFVDSTMTGSAWGETGECIWGNPKVSISSMSVHDTTNSSQVIKVGS